MIIPMSSVIGHIIRSNHFVPARCGGATYMPTTAEEAIADAIRLESAGDIPSALINYRRAAELDGADPRRWISLGVCLSKLKRWPDAAAALEKGIALKPRHAEADARFFLAEALAASGQIARAREQFEIVAAMAPSYPSYELPITEAKSRLAKLNLQISR
jgi:tetratricopeptide (TPR) repeat protein